MSGVALNPRRLDKMHRIHAQNPNFQFCAKDVILNSQYNGVPN
jgi:hypothetical protein